MSDQHSRQVLGSYGDGIGRMHFEGPDQYHGFEKRAIGEYWAIHPGAPNSDWARRPSGQDRSTILHAGDGTSWSNITFSEVVDGRMSPCSPSRMIRQDHWKLWMHLDTVDRTPVSLFNLEHDPHETLDLAKDPDHAVIRCALLSTHCALNSGQRLPSQA